MKQYLDLLAHCLCNGTPKSDRTGTGTRSAFGYQMRFNLADGFPIVTTKKVHFKSVVGELLWFLSGSTNANELRDKYGVTIWEEWARPDGELGPIYSAQWRSWLDWNSGNEIDQISNVIESIKRDPDSRRHVVSAWNVAELPLMALPPCHCLFQFYVADGKLSCQLYQRSADAFLGNPFNISSYALLTHMVAQQCGLLVGEFIWSGGDCHLYDNHVEQAELQLSREPLQLPFLHLKPAPDIFSYTPEHIELIGYVHHPAIPAPVAV